jgi:hypothetical protein
MSEAGKTLTFVAAGALALTGAYFIDTKAAVVDLKKQLVGQYLNENIDVSAPRRLRIVKFDRQTASTREFEVAEVDGVWSIPSKEDYPADATRQMAEAATALMDRKILRVAAETDQEHADLGVVDPLAAKLDSKATGVGTRVIMTDSDDKELVDMIIGKPVKDAPGQRYVRRSNQDVVYIVELDPASLSTDFENWIEDDLLKLNPFDIRKLFVNDYSADLGFSLSPQGRLQPHVNWDRRGEITLTYDGGEAKWQLADMKKFDMQKKEMVADAVGAEEEIDQDALGKLRNGLDDLLIVDVVKKPAGLSADLKAGEDFLKNQTAFEDLIDKGFSPVAVNGLEPEILSSEGEVVCTLRDGVEYVLRFGQLQVQTESAAEGEETADGKKGAEPAAAATDAQKDKDTPASKGKEKKGEEEGKNLRRYLFVMARFNKDAIEKPKLKELPPLPEKPAGVPAADEKKDAAAEGAKDEKPAAGEEAKAGEEKKDEKADDSPKDEKTAAYEAAVAARDEVEKENKQLQDEYDETVKSGEKKVADLNKRFGDWYYVISNDVYKQIHLGRDQIVHKKAKPAEAGQAPAGGAPTTGATSGLPELPAAAPEAAPASAPEAAPATAPETPPAATPASGEAPATAPAAETTAPAAEGAGEPEKPAAGASEGAPPSSAPNQ